MEEYQKNYNNFRKHIKIAWNLFMDSPCADTKLFGEAIDRFGECCKSIAKEID